LLGSSEEQALGSQGRTKEQSTIRVLQRPKSGLFREISVRGANGPDLALPDDEDDEPMPVVVNEHEREPRRFP
jgi:hypothetical protein